MAMASHSLYLGVIVPRRRTTSACTSLLLGLAFLGVGQVRGATIDVLLQNAAGTAQTAYGGWGSVSWQAIPALTDPNETYAGGEQLDFVGDSSNPGVYWAADSNYVYFRMRLDLDTVTSTYSDFHDAHALLIDVQGQHFDTATPANQLVTDSVADVYPDYAIAWDSKSGGGAQLKNHGLEMMSRDTTAANWGGIQMADLDGSGSAKTQSVFGAADINYTSTTDGYIRLTDAQPTTNFGNTTFVDFAVSWGYLITNTDLRAGQSWRFAVADISDSTDHNTLGKNADIGGGADTSTLLTAGGWSAFVTPVPEPSSLLLALPVLGMLRGRRRRSA